MNDVLSEVDRHPVPRRHWSTVASGLLFLAIFTLSVTPLAIKTLEQSATRKRLERIGLALKMYGNDSAGYRWPQLSDNDRIWAMELSRIYPEFLKEPGVLVAHGHPHAEAIQNSLRAVLEGPNPDYDTAEGLMALSYAYLGHIVTDEPGFRSLIRGRQLGLLGGESNTVTLPGGELIFPIREIVESCFSASMFENRDPFPPGAQSLTPILIETWQWKHAHDTKNFEGAHVLYMDGHVAWVPLGTFPVVPTVMDALFGIGEKG